MAGDGLIWYGNGLDCRECKNMATSLGRRYGFSTDCSGRVSCLWDCEVVSERKKDRRCKCKTQTATERFLGQTENREYEMKNGNCNRDEMKRHAKPTLKEVWDCNPLPCHQWETWHSKGWCSSFVGAKRLSL